MKTSKSLMKRRTPWFAIGLLSFSPLLFGFSGCETPKDGGPTSQATPCPPSKSPKDQLVDASKAAGVNVNAEEVFSVSRDSESVIAAPIAGWEKIPATALAKGVDFGFAYFSTEEPRVPAGYYRLKAFADVTAVGTVKGRVQLLDRGGQVTAELPADVEVHSLTVPAEAATQRSFVVGIPRERRQGIWFRCPNGVCIVIGTLRDRVLQTH